MAKEVALQVAMRCRPFSEDNAKLGVMCDETGDQKVVMLHYYFQPLFFVIVL